MNAPEAAVAQAPVNPEDERFMRLALALGRRGWGAGEVAEHPIATLQTADGGAR